MVFLFKGCMSNRFTATEKWDDPWFCGLSPAYKLFWIYLCEKCNHAGIWNVNWPLVKFHCWEKDFDITQFGERIVIINEEKWFIKKFVLFQQKIHDLNELNPLNKCHASIINILIQEGVISPLEGANKPLSRGLGIGKGIGKGKKNHNIDIIPLVHEVFAYFCLKLNKKILLSPERKNIIEKHLKDGRSVEEMKQAIDNFSKDDWQDRHKYCDIVYCLGIRNKINNLDRWLNSAKPSQPKIMEGF